MDCPIIAGKPLLARHVRLHSKASQRGRIRRGRIRPGLPSHLFPMRNDKRRSFDGINQLPDCRQSGSYRDVLVSREDTRLASLGALGVCVATHDPVWHSSVIAVTSEPLGETTRLAQFSPDPFLPMNSIPIVAISP